MNKEELKRLVRKQRFFYDETWNYLDGLGFPDEALDMAPDEVAVAYMLERLADLDAATPGGRGRRQTRDQERSEVPVSLSELELQRQGAFEEYVALLAACDEETRRFRTEVLGGSLLTAQQARQLIRSPAAQYLETSSFEFAGGDIPLIGHHATLESYKRESNGDDEVQHRVRVSVDPPGDTKTAEIAFHKEPRPARRRLRENEGDGQALYFVNENDRARYVSVWSHSVLERLRRLCHKMAQEHRWELAQATMFILTGEIPAVPALKVERSFRSTESLGRPEIIAKYIDATINITASPWVNSRTVEKAYRKAQIQILGSSGGKRPGLKQLELFRFVTKRIEVSNEPAAQEGSGSAQVYIRMPEGKSLVHEWNQAYPQWAYKTSVGDLNTRQFWRDYNRIRKTIAVGPPYQLRPRAATDRRSR